MNEESIKLFAELHNMGMKVTGGKYQSEVIEAAEVLPKDNGPVYNADEKRWEFINDHQL